MDPSHYVLIVAGTLATALPGAAQAFPPAWRPVFLGVAAICGLAATVAGAVSDKLTTKANVQRASVPPPAPITVNNITTAAPVEEKTP